jgi:hypothetical protein
LHNFRYLISEEKQDKKCNKARPDKKATNLAQKTPFSGKKSKHQTDNEQTLAFEYI